MSVPPSARRPVRLALAASFVLLAAGGLGAAPAGSATPPAAGAMPADASTAAVPPPNAPMTSASAPAPVHVDPQAAGLRLLAGATLAAPKVLDIVTVVEDSKGDERRSDTPSAVTFDLQSEVLFGKDSAGLSADSSSRIEAIADEIISQNAKLVRVFGFTDNLGTHAHGVVLSKQRAQAVYTALAKDLPDDGSIRFQVRGYAEQYPIAGNSTESGRRQNRRVEISFPKS